MIRRIIIEAVAQEDMRPPYNQDKEGGDWIIDGDTITVRSIGEDFENWQQPETFLYALHELIECMLCRKAGISQEQVDRFDVAHEYMQDHLPDAQPGDHPASPYRLQHRRACLIEFLVADMLGIVGYGRME
ncbi:MAG: hypothetical protein EPO09_21785 [Aquabacterium sp.]|nr:MAG: hypothetical protein EPO09_21785 [Aquabacterium sp.]